MEEAGNAQRADWWFYHLEGARLVSALAPLLEKCLENDWRVLVSSPSPDVLEALDHDLWSYADGSFLPHGIQGGGVDARRQPVLLSTACEGINGARALMLLNGQDAPGDGFDRVMVVFDGKDTAARETARDQFRRARKAGSTVRYFQQKPGGGWVENKA